MNIRDLSFYIFQILCAASLSLFSITLVCLIVNTSICGENQTCLAITSSTASLTYKTVATFGCLFILSFAVAFPVSVYKDIKRKLLNKENTNDH